MRCAHVGSIYVGEIGLEGSCVKHDIRKGQFCRVPEATVYT